MVAPFTPYVKTRNINWPNGRSKLDFYATGTKQKPPYVNTAYSATVTWSETTNRAWGNNTYSDSVRVGSMETATNVARKRLVDKLGDSSSLGATLTAERRETYGMLKGAVVSVFQAARAVRKGELVKAARIMGIAPPVERVEVRKRTRRGRGKLVKIRRTYLTLPTGREVAKSAANKWLWWSYGVKPLMGDAYNAVDVLQREQPWTRVEGTGTAVKTTVDNSSTFVSVTHTCKSRVRASVDVRVKNPNLWLANQLGLVNPIQMINEAVMFSFVVDWFSNLSQVISQMTDFVGLETSDPLTSSASLQSRSFVNKPGQAYYRELNWRRDLKRDLSMPVAKLKFAYERFEWQRGANAISLLVQFLKSEKRR